MNPATSSVAPSPGEDARARQRVFIYGMNYAPEPTGVGRYTGEIGSYLNQLGVDVDVVTSVPHYPGWVPREGYRNRYSVEELDSARVIRCPLFLRSEMNGLWRLFAPLSFAVTSAPIAFWRILRSRPDTVLCVEPTLFAVPIALLAARIIGARTVLHVQDLEIDAAFGVGHLSSRTLQAVAKWCECKVLSWFDAIVTISERMRQRLVAKGASSARLLVVRNWVYLDKIKPLGHSRRLRQELKVPDDTFVVLYAGNIGRKQALPLLLEAATKLTGYRQLRFILAGEGPEKRALVNKYGKLPNVQFLPVQPEERLCELLNLADAHVLPQHSGAADLVLPSKLGGMLASGKTCIVMADDKTELHEFLGNAAILTPAGDIDALAEAVLLVASGATPSCVEAQVMLAEQLCATTNLSALARVVTQGSSLRSESASTSTTAAGYEI